MTDHPKRRSWLKLAAGLLFAVVTYFGAYLNLMVRDSVAAYGPRPYYERFSGTTLYYWVDALFRPAHWLDRYVVRRAY